MRKHNFWLIMLFIISGVLIRLLPHAPNFTPLLAVALFSGSYLKKKYAFMVPIAAIFLSDIFLGLYDPIVMASVYGSMLAVVAIGAYIKKNKSWARIGAGALTAPLIFFLITNFTVWAFTPWYTHTLAGFIECFTLALPFFRNNLTSTLVYSGALFGAYEAATSLAKARENRRTENIFFK